MIYLELAAQIYLTQEVTGSVWLEYTTGFMVAMDFMFGAYLLFGEGSFPATRPMRELTQVARISYHRSSPLRRSW